MPEYMIRALIGLILIALNASLTGTFIVFRGAAFMVAGASHAALAGGALAILLTVNYGLSTDPMLGALGFALMLALLTAYSAGINNTGKMNVSIGVGFAFSMSIALLLISLIREFASRAWSLLIGDILLLTTPDLIMIACFTMVALVVTLLFYNEFIFISFDPEGAVAYGIKANIANYLMLAIMALSVVVTMKGVGAILVYAMLIAPAATGNEVAQTVRGVFITAFILAIMAGVIALVISYIIPVAVGALMALIAATSYMVVLVGKKSKPQR